MLNSVYTVKYPVRLAEYFSRYLTVFRPCTPCPPSSTMWLLALSQFCLQQDSSVCLQLNAHLNTLLSSTPLEVGGVPIKPWAKICCKARLHSISNKQTKHQKQTQLSETTIWIAFFFRIDFVKICFKFISGSNSNGFCCHYILRGGASKCGTFPTQHVSGIPRAWPARDQVPVAPDKISGSKTQPWLCHKILCTSVWSRTKIREPQLLITL